jgi:hypothetical protein
MVAALASSIVTAIAAVTAITAIAAAITAIAAVNSSLATPATVAAASDLASSIATTTVATATVATTIATAIAAVTAIAAIAAIATVATAIATATVATVSVRVRAGLDASLHEPNGSTLLLLGRAVPDDGRLHIHDLGASDATLYRLGAHVWQGRKESPQLWSLDLFIWYTARANLWPERKQCVESTQLPGAAQHVDASVWTLRQE